MSFDRAPVRNDVVYFNGRDDSDGYMDFIPSAWYGAINDQQHFRADVEFTMEMFGINFSSFGGPPVILSRYDLVNGKRAWFFQCSATQLSMNTSITGNSDVAGPTSDTLSLSLNTDYDFCFERASGVLRYYIDGVHVGGGAWTDTWFDSAEPIRISRWRPGSNSFQGLLKLKALRLTNDVARYASDGGYSVPSLPLPTQ